MKDLHNFYNKDESSGQRRFGFPPEKAVVDMVCACLYQDGHWHRGVISKIVNEKMVVVSKEFPFTC